MLRSARRTTSASGRIDCSEAHPSAHHGGGRGIGGFRSCGGSRRGGWAGICWPGSSNSDQSGAGQSVQRQGPGTAAPQYSAAGVHDRQRAHRQGELDELGLGGLWQRRPRGQQLHAELKLRPQPVHQVPDPDRALESQAVAGRRPLLQPDDVYLHWQETAPRGSDAHGHLAGRCAVGVLLADHGDLCMPPHV